MVGHALLDLEVLPRVQIRGASTASCKLIP